MADINKRLLTSSDGIPAPQHKVKGASKFEFTEGSSGAQHTKIVDSSGHPISIDEELKSIKRTQAEILDRLDKGIDTRVTGSIVEELQSYVDDDTFSSGSSSVWRYFSNVIFTASTQLKPVNVSNYSKKSIYFENNTNHIIRSIEVYGTSVYREENQGNVSRNDVRLFSFNVSSLEPGESVFITENEYPELKQPCMGLAMRTAREEGFNYEDTEGSITLRFYGSKI